MSNLPWRVGRKVGRTIYDADNNLIGCMDTIQDAAHVVHATELASKLIPLVLAVSQVITFLQRDQQDAAAWALSEKLNAALKDIK